MAWPYFYPTQLRPQSFGEGGDMSMWSPLGQNPQQTQQQGQEQQQPDMNPFAKYKFMPNMRGF